MERPKDDRHDRAEALADDPTELFDFSPAEIDQATAALELFFQDSEMEREMMRVKDLMLIDELNERGISRALAKRLVRELVARGVFITGRQYATIRSWCSLDGSSQRTDILDRYKYLYMTRRRVRTFFAQYRAEREHRRSVVQSRLPDPNLCEFRCGGEFWAVTYDGKTVYLRCSVGLSYISRLLCEPHRQLPAVTLLAYRAGIDPGYSNGSSGEFLDDQARKEYADRYRQLREDLNEAKGDNDLGRIPVLETELEQLSRELLRASGLGGRARELSSAEKVRKAVWNAINRAITKIEKHHEPLARHLTRSISTGLTVCYAPDPPIDWLVQT